MPDLLTHLAAARVPGAFLRDRRLQALLVLGTFLPDLAAKGLHLVAHAPENFIVPTHSVAGLALLSYALSFLLEERLRTTGCFWLFAGALLHLAVDLVKDQALGSAWLLYPFSTAGMEFGWIDPENVILLLPLDAAVLGATWLLERRLRAVRQ
jgi:hypothetical protein